MGLVGLITSWFNKLVILVFIFCFLASGLILNVLQIFLLPLYWINRYLYRILNAKIVYFHWAREFIANIYNIHVNDVIYNVQMNG